MRNILTGKVFKPRNRRLINSEGVNSCIYLHVVYFHVFVLRFSSYFRITYFHRAVFLVANYGYTVSLSGISVICGSFY